MVYYERTKVATVGSADGVSETLKAKDIFLLSNAHIIASMHGLNDLSTYGAHA
jgi:hypothetical protein